MLSSYRMHTQLLQSETPRKLFLRTPASVKQFARRHRIGRCVAMAGGEASTAAPPPQDTSRSSKPAIFGVTETESEITVIASEEDLHALEQIGVELNNAITQLVASERDLFALADAGAEPDALLSKQKERAEASSQLERRLGAIEALLTSRRKSYEAPKRDAVKVEMPSFLQPPPMVKTTGPAAGSGYEIVFQGFHWESCREPGGWYNKLRTVAQELAEAGFTAVWLPPASDSVSAQGYLPRDYYDLNSKFGTEAELRNLIATLHEHNLKAIADIVINHRCAHYQSNDGKWNKYGGRLAWSTDAICSNNPSYGGTGNYKQTEDYPAAPNIDHTNTQVRNDIVEWLQYLRKSIGYDGWRFDFTKGYDAKFCQEYVDKTVPEMAFGEYWDTCAYQDGVLNYNQDAHRQRTVDWCDRTGGTCAAFDFTLKGVLQEAVSRKEYWRLVDSKGRAPGVLGIWPSRAITFLENHDTGSTLQHWPFPWNHVAEGYCYLLTHCGTPSVFFDHFYYDDKLRKHITEFMKIRKRFGINYKSEIDIRKAYNHLYAAVIDKKIAMKIGPANWAPSPEDFSAGQKDWALLHSGPNFAVWEAIF